MKSFLILLASLPLFAYQDCRITILVDPIQESVSANDMTNGAGDDILSDAGALTIDGLINPVGTPIDTSSPTLNLSLEIIRQRVWRCRFSRSVNRQNLSITYELRSLNGEIGFISLGTSRIPVSVTTAALSFRGRDRIVFGDIAFRLDLSGTQFTQAGSYGGVLTINVIEN